MKEFFITGEADTKKFGKSLAQSLKAGAVVALIGDLGTGKTTLTKYIAEGLGIMEMITSPTFTIVQEYYSGTMPLYHFDVYRINNDEEMFEIGYDEYFYGQGVTVVEWADLIMDLIPKKAIVIDIKYGENPDERVYTVRDN